MRAAYNNSGHYPMVILSRDGERKARYVHHLVLEAFVSPCPDGMEARHLDGNPYNPDRDNLAWGTISENQFDQVRHGTHPWASRDRCENDHELTDDNTWIEYYPDGTFRARRCKACNRDRSTKQRAKRQADERRCKEEGCDKPYAAVGWCSMHYAQNYKQQPGKAEKVAARNAAWCRERKEAGNPTWVASADLPPEKLERRRALARERQRRYRQRKRSEEV
jgi:hypothetical protein